MHRSFIGLLCVLFCLTLTGCGGGGSQAQTSPQTRSAVLDQEFTLGVGQDARLEAEGLTVTLRGVPDDSRCPEDAQCVWEGDARVQVELKAAPDPGAVVELHTSPRIGSSEGTYLSYTVRLVSVAPNQRLNRTIKPDEYTVTLVVKRG